MALMLQVAGGHILRSSRIFACELHAAVLIKRGLALQAGLTFGRNREWRREPIIRFLSSTPNTETTESNSSKQQQSSSSLSPASLPLDTSFDPVFSMTSDEVSHEDDGQPSRVSADNLPNTVDVRAFSNTEWRKLVGELARCCKRKDAEKGLKIVAYMKANYSKPTELMYQLYMYLLLQQNMIKEMEQALEEMKEHNLKLSDGHFTLYIMALARNGLISEALEV